MQSDKTKGELRLFVLEAARPGPDQEQDPGGATVGAEPMMQRKLCGFGPRGFDAPLNVRSPAKLSKSVSAGVQKLVPLRNRPRFEETPGGWPDVEYGCAIVSGSRK
jgi:hypothetical protein